MIPALRSSHKSRSIGVQKRAIVLSVTAGLLMALALPVAAKDAKDSGFTGKWVLDKKSGNIAEGLQDLEQRIKQNGNEIVIASKFPEPKTSVVPLVYLGIMTNDLRLSTDGAETQNQIGPFQQASKTTVNGNKMETDWEAVVKGDHVTGHWTRTLSDDGKHMTLLIKENSTQGQHGEAELHLTRK